MAESDRAFLAVALAVATSCGNPNPYYPKGIAKILAQKQEDAPLENADLSWQACAINEADAAEAEK